MAAIYKDLVAVIRELPQNRIFSYVNSDSLSKEYLEAAADALDEPYVYIILTSTGSAAANVIEFFSGCRYSHASLALDAGLKTIVSYNGGNGIGRPGMNHERVEFFLQKPDARIAVYRLKATPEQKRIILDEICNINRIGSSYNVTGVLWHRSFLENIQVCSQFVYRVLKKAGLCYFEKDPAKVQPVDFLDCDVTSVLEPCYECYVKDLVETD